jgi:hypothetical protein
VSLFLILYNPQSPVAQLKLTLDPFDTFFPFLQIFFQEPYFECFKVSKLMNLLELYFATYFWMDFASVLCTIFEQLLPINGGYLTTEANVE